MLDYQAFKDSIAELQGFYGGNVLNGGILEAAWYETLKHLPLPKLQSAIARCFKKHPRQYNFFPAVDQILEFATYPERPPGECVKQDFKAPCLPSYEQRLTPEQISEMNRRGRLMAQIITNTAGLMTFEQKEELIEQLKRKETHELEAIASTAAQSQTYRKRSSATLTNPGFNNLGGTLNQIKRDLESAL